VIKAIDRLLDDEFAALKGCVELLAPRTARDFPLAHIPLRRVGTPDEIAAPILFLCTSHAGFITGEVFNVNGGAVLVG